MYTSLTMLTLAGAQGTYAWGTLGHETVAFIAQHYVKNETQAWAQNILSNNSDAYLAGIATWADSYRYTDEGAFSAPLHYIDAEDDPPTSCNVDFDRDCGSEGCVVSAIVNYTQRVQQPMALPALQVNYALRWLVHFLGDITQPLHDEALLIGGNDIDVTYGGVETNLHHIWDSNMAEQLRGGYSLADARDWAANLTAEIDSGKYEKLASSWIEGDSIDDAKSAALGWATDANAKTCTVVIPDGYEVLENATDLNTTYYDSAIDTIELQIAKGGYRLANWLDQLAATQTNKTPTAYYGKKYTGPDLSGKDILPAPRELSKAKLARLAVGWDCGHEH